MGLLGSFIGGRPEQVPFVPVDTQASQLKTVTGNTAIIPQSIAQANALNLGNFDNIDRMLAQASGGVYSKLRDKALEVKKLRDELSHHLGKGAVAPMRMMSRNLAGAAVKNMI